MEGHRKQKGCFNLRQTFHLLHTAQSVFQRAQCGRLAVVLLVSWHVKFQLLQSFNHLLLVLRFCRLLTTARWTSKHPRVNQSTNEKGLLQTDWIKILILWEPVVHELTCSRCLKGYPALSSADCRRWSCWAEMGCGSLNCAREKVHFKVQNAVKLQKFLENRARELYFMLMFNQTAFQQQENSHNV